MRKSYFPSTPSSVLDRLLKSLCKLLFYPSFSNCIRIVSQFECSYLALRFKVSRTMNRSANLFLSNHEVIRYIAFLLFCLDFTRFWKSIVCNSLNTQEFSPKYFFLTFARFSATLMSRFFIFTSFLLSWRCNTFFLRIAWRFRFFFLSLSRASFQRKMHLHVVI